MPVRNPTLEIDLSALCANYRRLASACPRAEAAAVVKCDAYGLGAAAVARTLAAKEGCRTFFVAYSEEGAALRAAIGDGATIFVFNGPFVETLPLFRSKRLTPVLNSLEQATLWSKEMPNAPAALHIDTGMNRLGVPLTELPGALALKGLAVDLVMSHLACASNPAHPMNARQLAAFNEAAGRFPRARKSLSSSGGVLIDGSFGLDVARLGVGLYGVNPHDAAPSPVESVARLTAPVIQVREIEPGESVGYGATFRAKRKSTLATVSLGYGDGFLRSGSNRAGAFLGDAICRVVGRVSMDLMALDVTDAPSRPAIGDRAEFFGPSLSIDEAAAACGTIGYELLTAIGGLARPEGLGGRVERRYFFDGAPAAKSLIGVEGI